MEVWKILKFLPYVNFDGFFKVNSNLSCGGFKVLKIQFEDIHTFVTISIITFVPNFNSLVTAHSCFLFPTMCPTSRPGTPS